MSGYEKVGSGSRSGLKGQADVRVTIMRTPCCCFSVKEKQKKRHAIREDGRENGEYIHEEEVICRMEVGRHYMMSNMATEQGKW